MAAIFRPSFSCLLLVVCSFADAAVPSKPNVIFMLTDDLGYSDIGCYGARKVKTPHIDRLAAEGLRFTDFHTAASICSPSRAAIMAARNHHRIGLGSHSLTAMGFPGYNAFPPESGKSGSPERYH